MGAGPSGSPLEEDVDAAVQAVLDWLNGLPTVPLTGLLGFSQGGAMAVQLFRYRPRAFAFAVVLSGFVIPGEHPGDVELAQLHPPAFWGRGLLDTVISDLRVEQAASWLQVHTSLEAKAYETGHSITQGELADVSRFIESKLGPEPSPA